MTKRRMGVLEGAIPPDTDEVEYYDASAWLLPEDERPTEEEIERGRRITERLLARGIERRARK